MTQTINDLTLTNSAWLDINTTSGIAVGARFDIQNKGNTPILLYEGTDEPLLTEDNGHIVMTTKDRNNTAYITQGSLKIWGKSYGQGETPISVQER